MPDITPVVQYGTCPTCLPIPAETEICIDDIQIPSCFLDKDNPMSCDRLRETIAKVLTAKRLSA